MGRSVFAKLALVLFCTAAAAARAQVFTVGEKTATADIKTDFKATHVELPGGRLQERGRRQLVRDLGEEQGYAHRVLPVGSVLDLHANGNLALDPEAYKMLVYKKGSAAGPGDRVMITALEFKPDRILVDFNGGPYVKHRFLRHIQVGIGTGAGMATTAEPDLGEQATGCRIALLFEGGVPDLSAPEVKALLEPLVDFGVKTGEQAYADTLPAPLKSAIDAHEVLVGMNRRMVLASLGQPENKLRETSEDGVKYEEWIYGRQPQTVKFIRFVGDRVALIKIAALGRPLDVHTHEESAGILPPPEDKTVAVGDTPTPAGTPPPSLMKPGETAEMGSGTTMRKVQLPDDAPAPIPPATVPSPTIPQQFVPAPAGTDLL